MTLTIEMPPELEKSVRQQAAKNGLDVSTFVLQAIGEKVAKARHFDDICAPFAQAVAAAGIEEEEFDEMFNEIRNEAWQQKQSQRP